MQKKFHFIALIIILISLGVGVTAYKIWGLGFSLAPQKKITVWRIDSEITFNAFGETAEVSLNLPDNTKDFTVVNRIVDASDYSFRIQEVNGTKRGIWSIDKAEGPQKIYLRSTIYKKNNNTATQAELDTNSIPLYPLTKEQKKLSVSLIEKAEQSAKEKEKEKKSFPLSVAISLLEQINTPEANPDVALLLDEQSHFDSSTNLLVALITEADVISRPVKGFFMDTDTVNQKLESYIEVYTGTHWVLLDPVTATPLDSSSFLLWQTNNESVLEVTGGRNSTITFSSLASQTSANKAAIDAGLRASKSLLVDFSLYSLPIEFQNTFRLLLLIPFGALVVAIMRNLVGIRTTGTFLPILIALTFMQTTLLAGLALFVIIVSLGLILRSYLSNLNLLLVPRISAVLVFVIIIYLGLAVASHKLGSDFGLMASSFPMIIIAWTIERMSILWEEEGPKEVFIQSGGSLLTASFIYLLITNSYVKHISYAFPELLLVVLALILCIGSYTGYRLSELRRFEPLGRM